MPAWLGFTCLVALVIAVFAYVCLSTSPWLRPVLGRDSGVFLYAGSRILAGQVPYRDVWDHKGPLIYYIDALGLLIGHGSRWGVWLLEVGALGAGAGLAYAGLTESLGKWAA